MIQRAQCQNSFQPLKRQVPSSSREARGGRIEHHNCSVSVVRLAVCLLCCHMWCSLASSFLLLFSSARGYCTTWILSLSVDGGPLALVLTGVALGAHLISNKYQLQARWCRQLIALCHCHCLIIMSVPHCTTWILSLSVGDGPLALVSLLALTSSLTNISRRLGGADS